MTKHWTAEGLTHWRETLRSNPENPTLLDDMKKQSTPSTMANSFRIRLAQFQVNKPIRE